MRHKEAKAGVLTGEPVEAEVEGEAPSLASVCNCPECGGQIQMYRCAEGHPEAFHLRRRRPDDRRRPLAAPDAPDREPEVRLVLSSPAAG